MGRGGRTQGRRAALHEHEPRAAAGDDAGVRYVQEEPKLKPVAQRTLAHLTSSCTVFGGETDTDLSRDSGSRHVFSPLLQFSSGSDRSAVQYLQMEAAKEEKSAFARPASRSPSERNTFLWCGRRSRLGRRTGERAMMGSVGPLELIARGGFSPE